MRSFIAVSFTLAIALCGCTAHTYHSTSSAEPEVKGVSQALGW